MLFWENMRLFQLLYKAPVPEFSVMTSFDLSNQSLIKCDVGRTKSDKLSLTEKKELETMLTLYCKEAKVSYKQGMNEIAVAFLLLTRKGMPLYVAYTCFKNFIRLCLRTMFEDQVRLIQTFRPLHGFFIVMSLLLQYFVPSISNFLKKNDIQPELYSTSWFLTMFSTKIKSVDLLYKL